MLRTFLLPSLLLSFLVHAQSSSNSGPSVALSYGTFVGVSEGGLDKFLGVPFAQAGRFELPRTPSNFSEPQQATSFGPACPQQSITPITLPGFPGPIFGNQTLNTSEDCLLVNVIKPANLSSETQLPVVFWIYGGAFQIGDTSANDGSTVVARSIALGEPIIYVSANYRLNAFGFAASKETKAAGITNLGLRDQRFALHWVQNNIHLFGGDKTKVTIWGESAGAISVGIHMLINGGKQEGLFRGAFMESGSPSYPLRDISAGQPFYDQLVVDTGCSNSTDTLACLKSVPFDTLQNAVNKSPNFQSFTSLQLPWQPRIDGNLITEDPQDSLVKGAFSKIPLANGDCDDEGTLFAVPQQNLTTSAEATDFLHSNYFAMASDKQFERLARLYPSNPADGSPFGTGSANQLTPEFKRLAAFQGDVAFQAPRRFFLQIASKRQNVWSFSFKRGKSTPFLGSFHTSDLAEFYSSSETPDFQGTDAVVNFVNTLNPNYGAKSNISSLIYWPMYSTSEEAPPLLTFVDPDVLVITNDTFRLEAIKVMTELSRQFPP